MPSYHASFTGRVRGAIGIFYPIITTVTGPSADAARGNLYQHYEHLHGLKLAEVPDGSWRDCYPQAVIRFVPTHRNADGLRTLSRHAQGRDTFDTPEAAQAWIDAVRANNSADTIRSLFGPVDTFSVCSCPCWPGHFDPCGVYFDDGDIVTAPQDRA